MNRSLEHPTNPTSSSNPTSQTKARPVRQLATMDIALIYAAGVFTFKAFDLLKSVRRPTLELVGQADELLEQADNHEILEYTKKPPDYSKGTISK